MADQNEVVGVVLGVLEELGAWAILAIAPLYSGAKYVLRRKNAIKREIHISVSKELNKRLTASDKEKNP